MKWLSFTVVCVAGLVALGILAVDERNVLWEGTSPLCPYCRSPLRPLSIACTECGRTVDWVGTAVECGACLDSADVDNLRDRYDALKIETGAEPPWLAAFPPGYFHVMDRGACGYCAGLKQVDEGRGVHACPVCRGDGRCPFCGGDRIVDVGSEEAHRRALLRRREWEEGERREKTTRLPLLRGRLVDEDVRGLRGSFEAYALRDEEGRELADRAAGRIAAAFAALADAHAAAATASPAD